MKEEFNTVFFGSFLGEIGWEISRWQGFCRFRSETEFKNKKKIVASYPGREPFYKDFVDEFIPLPKWFLDKKYEIDSYDAVNILPEDYASLLQYFKQFYDESTTREIRTPRGCNYILNNSYQKKLQKFRGSEEANSIRDGLIKDQKYIVISARGRERASWRNWSEKNWGELVSKILDNYKDLTVVLAGAPNGSFLSDLVGDRILNIMNTPVEQSIDLSISFLNNAICSITSQSGSTHISLHSMCPSLILGHEADRHLKHENYLKTSGMFITTPKYDIDVDYVLKAFNQFYKGILERKEEKK